jgi:hypothetical protein
MLLRYVTLRFVTLRYVTLRYVTLRCSILVVYVRLRKMLNKSHYIVQKWIKPFKTVWCYFERYEKHHEALCKSKNISAVQTLPVLKSLLNIGKRNVALRNLNSKTKLNEATKQKREQKVIILNVTHFYHQERTLEKFTLNSVAVRYVTSILRYVTTKPFDLKNFTILTRKVVTRKNN